MIAFRHADPRFPFLREDNSQSTGRWTATGELTHYFCDTPYRSWAEFLRNEEVDDPENILTIRRVLRAVDIGDAPMQIPDLPHETITDGLDTWSTCQEYAQLYRIRIDGITSQSAALISGGAHGWRVDGGLQLGPERDGKLFVLFGLRPDLVGWPVTVDGRPGVKLLTDVKHF